MDPATEILIPEGVWGPALAELATRRAIRQEPDLWRDRTALLAAAGGARALIVRNRTIVDAELLDAAPELRVVGRAGVGLDNIDVGAADAREIVVIAAGTANARSVAEYTLGAALALARTITVHDRRVRAGQWRRDLGIELAGRTWGVIGFGSTGRAVATLVSGVTHQVLAYDPYAPADHGAGQAARRVSLEVLLRESDIVSVHLPSTPSTRGLLDAATLAQMRPGSLLVSVGRGDVLNEESLASALAHGPLAGAALDVRATEPPTPGPLDDLDNVILTPHVAGLTQESQDRIVILLATEVDHLLDGAESDAAVGSLHRVPALPFVPAVSPGDTP